MNPLPRQKAYYYAIATVFLWSTVATAFKLTLEHLTPLQLLFQANLVSAVTLLLVLAFERRLRELRCLGYSDIKRGFLLGLLNPLLYYLVLFKAYDLLPAQVAQPINYTWAIMLSLLSVPFLGHRLSRSELISILICYSGVVVVVTHGDFHNIPFSSPLGIVLALSSTLIWSLYWIYNTRSSLDPVVSLFLNFASALPLTGALNWFSGETLTLDTTGLLGAMYVGVVEMGLAFLFWLKAMRLTHSIARIASLIYFSPFLSLLLIQFVLHEDVRWSSIAGLVLIVSGNLVQRFPAEAKSEKRSG